VTLSLDVTKPQGAGEEWDLAFERRIRDVASRAVAHLKRGDAVAIATSAGTTVRSDRSAGADPLLRFLALLESTPAEAKPDASAKGDAKPGGARDSAEAAE
jgi:uncharacterized protein (DUF58 family)